MTIISMEPPSAVELVFVDTGAWVALLNKKDQYHEQAVLIHQTLLESRRALVTTEFVFLETGGAFSKATQHLAVTDLRSAFLNSPNGHLVPISAELLNEGWRSFRQKNDKDWSVVDCLSFLVMKQFKIREAFAFDHHFHQAGFHLIK